MRRSTFNGLYAVTHRDRVAAVGDEKPPHGHRAFSFAGLFFTRRYARIPVPPGGNKPDHPHRAFGFVGMFYTRRYVRVPAGVPEPPLPEYEPSHYIPAWRRRRR